jgi:ADP-heptose:LPS heptosyltransferase
MRILIVKLGSIGDIVHTLPALAALRAAQPQAEISWVVERRSAEILRDNPLLDRLIEVDTKALRRGLMSGETLRAPRQQLRRLLSLRVTRTGEFPFAFEKNPRTPQRSRHSQSSAAA